MKQLPLICRVMLVLVCTGTIGLAQVPVTPGSPPPALPENTRSLEGTTWAGTDSDGDFYEYTFLPGGRLRYKTNTARKEIVTFEKDGDYWAQNGPVVIIVKNFYSSQVGTMQGNRIVGKAWNFVGKRWTWEVTERR